MTPDPEAWRRAGIDDAARATFEQWRITLDAARRWWQAGVRDGLNATRWTISGTEPDQVDDWTRAGIDSVEALQWHQHGFDRTQALAERAHGRNPSTALQNKQAMGATGMSRAFVRNVRGDDGTGVGPAFEKWLLETGHGNRMTHWYLSEGWVSDDALPWAQAEIPVEAARLWRTLGVRPAEASRLQQAGHTAAETVGTWWGAGVPLEQVAAWLGAGFTAQEAAEQIAAGVDPDRAAVLRALRDDDEA